MADFVSITCGKPSITESDVDIPITVVLDPSVPDEIRNNWRADENDTFVYVIKMRRNIYESDLMTQTLRNGIMKHVTHLIKQYIHQSDTPVESDEYLLEGKTWDFATEDWSA